jgi:hypothetical protein
VTEGKTVSNVSARVAIKTKWHRFAYPAASAGINSHIFGNRLSPRALAQERDRKLRQPWQWRDALIAYAVSYPDQFNTHERDCQATYLVQIVRLKLAKVTPQAIVVEKCYGFRQIPWRTLGIEPPRRFRRMPVVCGFRNVQEQSPTDLMNWILWDRSKYSVRTMLQLSFGGTLTLRAAAVIIAPGAQIGIQDRAA